MPDTAQALMVFLLGLLPGALYVWGFEREAGQWGISAVDRVLRFIGASAIFHAIFVPVTWALWRSQIRTHDLVEGRTGWWLLWLFAVVYVGLPATGGVWVGSATRNQKPWVRYVAGPHPAPRAWDHVFGYEPKGWIRLKLKSGQWVGGLFATVESGQSYAAGFPHEQDLYLTTIADVDPVSGEFKMKTAKRSPAILHCSYDGLRSNT